MKVGLIGFGKTGKAIASVLLTSGTVDLRWVLRKSNALENRSISEILGIETNSSSTILSAAELSAGELLSTYPVDVIVDFSSADGIGYYGHEAMKRHISIVTAVSSYPEEMLHLIQLISRRTRIIHSPNITLGINFLLTAAKVLKNIDPQIDIEIVEEHFRDKPEVSGTARIIAKHLDIDDSSIKSVRAGGIIGTHEIIFGFPYQTVRLKHESISREAFGNGILFALDNLPRRKTGLYTMEDLLAPYFQVGKAEASHAKSRPWWRIW
jgi:4-hydroxy-tetrahydrodipicolinate reductase